MRIWLIITALVARATLAAADDLPALREEMWALPLPVPTIAYVVRPVGDGPFPLAIMNHGVALDPVQRGFFPAVEFRDA
ncbi:MAG: dienelactone hydrolase, partial [Bradyrhizobium sp.]